MSYYPVTVVEVGTTSVKVLVGQPDEENIVNILGWGESFTAGMRKGEVTDQKIVKQALDKALEAASRSSDTDIKSVVLVCSCGEPQCQKLTGTVNVATRHGKIDPDTIADAEESAESTRLDSSRMSLCSARRHFSVDGRSGISNPLEFTASSLTVEKLRMHIDKNCFETLKDTVEQAGVDVVSQTFSGICAVTACTDLEQRKNGVLVIDLGGGVTKWCAYYGGSPCSMGALAVGGDHITADLCTAFKISRENAEKIKKRNSSAIVDAGKCNPRTVTVNETLSQCSIDMLSANTVVNARIDETLRIVYEKLSDDGYADFMNSGVVLCGGGACQNDICIVARKIFKTPCTIAEIPSIHSELDHRNDIVAFASAYGALVKAAQREIENEKRETDAGFFSKLIRRRTHDEV